MMVEKHNRGFPRFRDTVKDYNREAWPLYFVKPELNEKRLQYLISFVDVMLEHELTGRQSRKGKVSLGVDKARHAAGIVKHTDRTLDVLVVRMLGKISTVW